MHACRWWSEETVAVVTGGNKGIGFAVVKKLAEMGLTVVLTARDVGRGKQAVETLISEFGLNGVKFMQLDVTDPCSISTFVSQFQKDFCVLDILVNNAGVSFNEINQNSVQHAARTMTEEEIEEEVVGKFLQTVKEGTWEGEGWPSHWTDYSVSKLALNAYSRILAERHRGEGLSVNCFCPGFTQTSMTRGRGTHSAEYAAELAVGLALLPPDLLTTGNFYVNSNSSANVSKL
ncbi:Carbonyl reductase [NADPH] 1 [Linum perenne]